MEVEELKNEVNMITWCDDVIMISLVDQVLSLKKQLAAKEQTILEKEKQVGY